MGNVRAFRSILHFITQFCLTREINGQRHGSLYGFVSSYSEGALPRVGDLVAQQAAPVSQFSLSWLRETRPAGAEFTCTQYLLESVETGELCWWHNISLDYLNRSEVAAHPEWQWSDRQFSFNDRWERTHAKAGDGSLMVPMSVEFGSGFEVTLRACVRYFRERGVFVKTFPDWRKVTIKIMTETFREFIADYNGKPSVHSIKSEGGA